MDLLVFAFFAATVVGSIYTTVKGRERVKNALRSTFAELKFTTPEGMVSGTALRVVKVSKQGMPFAYDEVFTLQADYQHSDSFWYCVGPGPAYFLAIPMVTTGFRKVSVRWAIRPLTAERMRGALTGDAEALRLAFGAKADELLA
ncbi:MAG TPA: hypothetical protein VJ484_01045 [Lysobacter sp.]|nr:hypothetical protein [Lysobacter sp.]